MTHWYDRTIDEEEYYKDLERRQQEHLDRVKRLYSPFSPPFQPCLHDQCPSCLGTGVRADGSMCIHNLSCPCSKCTPWY